LAAAGKFEENPRPLRSSNVECARNLDTNTSGCHGPFAQMVIILKEGAMEDRKREAFARLAEKRTNAVLERIRLLGNLSNPYAYSYGEEDVKLIFTALERELKTARAKFQNHRKPQFKLPR
jgi:hypothetical protein